MMQTAADIVSELGDEWIPYIYSKEIRSDRSRSHQLDIPARENSASIQHTLLGIELKVGKKRFACPDLSTARYLRVFARVGAGEFAIPYDISKIPGLADKLESAWQRMLLVLQNRCKNKTPQVKGRVRAALIRKIREQITEIGPGPVMPKFNKPASQRRA